MDFVRVTLDLSMNAVYIIGLRRTGAQPSRLQGKASNADSKRGRLRSSLAQLAHHLTRMLLTFTGGNHYRSQCGIA